MYQSAAAGNSVKISGMHPVLVFADTWQSTSGLIIRTSSFLDLLWQRAQ